MRPRFSFVYCLAFLSLLLLNSAMFPPTLCTVVEGLPEMELADEVSGKVHYCQLSATMKQCPLL